MIYPFTDFGAEGLYTSQLEAVLYSKAPTHRVINLLNNAPRNNPSAGACSGKLPRSSIFLCVVDPGVGNFEARPVMLRMDGRWFTGPDNGLFDMVRRRSSFPCACPLGYNYRLAGI